ncbi:MAG: hypothetical protein JWM11_6273 [Planctomycetaceae bacterium]|nr:hypothetical protein [Planctomycetaceae bacterium]
MKTKTIPELPAVSAWEHVMNFEESISKTAARALLKVKFMPSDMERMQELAAKARQGDLTISEEIEIETFERLGCLLDILHMKSLGVLEQRCS